MDNENEIESMESNVRYYSRIFPSTFSKAKGSFISDINDKKYLDFFSGAGALNYGHNNQIFKEKLISYIESDGITHSLDMMTDAKKSFMESFQYLILSKRNLEYKIQFTGPTGTDTIEAALKLARKYTKRKNIIYFSNSYHGMSMGSLSITPKKNRIGIPVGFTIEIPFYNENSNTNNALELYLKSIDKSDYPAAIVLETVQAEGGINVASIEWLQKIQSIASHYGILLIADEVQVGVGRTGKFFSFERAEMSPDIVCISKSISGYGIPLSLLLMKPHLDIWDAGEHTGTFRGVNLAFITAKEALIQYWHNENFTAKIQNLSEILEQNLKRIAKDKNFLSCGIGLIYGLNVKDAEYAARVRQRAFDQGLIFETCGPTRSVIKIIPPLIITKEELMQGLEILEKSF